VIAWSISDCSFSGIFVEMPKAVKSYDVESAMLAPRRICVVVTVDFGVVVINNDPFWS
jgi:hypothetical protein